MRVRFFTTIRCVLPALALAAAAQGCSKQNSYHDEAVQDNAAEATVREQQLDEVVGAYCGTMTLTASGLDFDVKLTLSRAEDNLHSSQSTDPTLIARVPKLVGSMRFPAVDAAGEDVYHTLPELIQNMGGMGALAFDNGDYSSAEHRLYLPYSVPGHTQGEYGEIRGTFSGGTISGTWLSNSFQPVGDFKVSEPCPAASPGAAGGGK